jgi:RNA polymerase sigma-70 factor (ECF subfamily)
MNRNAATQIGDSTSRSLICRLKAADPEAWRRLVDLYGPLVYSWCRQARMQPADAADVLQEVFRAVAGKIGEFRHDRPGDTFRGWLRVIARNKIRDHYRSREGQLEAAGGSDAYRRFLELSDDASESDHSRVALSGLFHQGLAQIQAEFEARTWQAFWEVTVRERPAPEVAQQLGMTPAAVRQAKSRVLRRLRQQLGDLM